MRKYQMGTREAARPESRSELREGRENREEERETRSKEQRRVANRRSGGNKAKRY